MVLCLQILWISSKRTIHVFPCPIRRIKVQSLSCFVSPRQKINRCALAMRSVPIILLNSSPEEQGNSVSLEEVRCSSSLPVAFPLHSTPPGGISAPILHFPTTPESCSAPPQNSDSVSHSQCLQNSCWFFALRSIHGCLSRSPCERMCRRTLGKRNLSVPVPQLASGPAHVRLSSASSLCSLHTGCTWPPWISNFICLSGMDLRLRP